MDQQPKSRLELTGLEDFVECGGKRSTNAAFRWLEELGIATKAASRFGLPPHSKSFGSGPAPARSWNCRARVSSPL